MITVLIITAVLAAAVAGWFANDLTKGRRLRRQFARHLDKVEQLLSDFAATTGPPSPPPISSLLGVPVITNPLLPPGTAFIVATDFLDPFDGRDQ